MTIKSGPFSEICTQACMETDAPCLLSFTHMHLSEVLFTKNKQAQVSPNWFNEEFDPFPPKGNVRSPYKAKWKRERRLSSGQEARGWHTCLHEPQFHYCNLKDQNFSFASHQSLRWGMESDFPEGRGKGQEGLSQVGLWCIVGQCTPHFPDSHRECLEHRGNCNPHPLQQEKSLLDDNHATRCSVFSLARANCSLIFRDILVVSLEMRLQKQFQKKRFNKFVSSIWWPQIQWCWF